MSVKITIEADGEQHEFFESDDKQYVCDMSDWYMRRDETGMWAVEDSYAADGLSILLDHAQEQRETSLKTRSGHEF